MTDSEKLDLLLNKFTVVESGMQAMGDRIQGMGDRIQALDDRMQGMDDRMQTMDDRMQGMDDRVQVMDNRIQAMDDRMQTMGVDIQQLKVKVSSVELTLENETNRNIRIIAEGHLDLSRKLDEALTVENEKELLLIRVNILENELRKLKEQLANIA